MRVVAKRIATRPSGAESCDVKYVDAERVAAALTAAPSPSEIDDVANIFRLLADPTRVSILHALATAELCNCDLASLLGISESAVSHQMRELRLMKVVSATRRGRMIYYRLNDRHVRHILLDTLKHAREDGRAAPIRHSAPASRRPGIRKGTAAR
jgi:DNA-binding transcriptional ArsR family regulator